MYRHAGYISDAVESEKRKPTIDKAVKRIRAYIKAKKIVVDAIAFTGLSGTLIGPSVADRLGLKLLCVRKGEHTHSMSSVEGWFPQQQSLHYIIIDDFIDMGDTVNKIQKAIKHECANQYPPICYGVYLYYNRAHTAYSRTRHEAAVGIPIINSRKDYDHERNDPNNC